MKLSPISSYWLSKKKISVFGLGVIVAFYLFNGIASLNAQSVNSDEPGFYNYAKRLVKGNPERSDPVVDNSKTPVIVLNLIPRAVEQFFSPGKHKTDWGKKDIINGRYVSLLISVLVILLVYFWASDLYGMAAGLFAAFLMSFSPGFLANAVFVTTDSYSVLFLLATFYLMWRMLRRKSFKYFIFFCITVALGQLVKQALFHLYVLIPFTLLIYYLVSKPIVRWMGLLKYVFIFIFIQWLVINLGYYFYGTNMRLDDYHFMSNLFQSVQRIFPPWLRLPVPKPFVDGLDMTKYYDQLGGGFDPVSSFGKVTILNHFSVGGSFWYYYFVTILFKAPVTYFILTCWAVLILIRKTTFRLFSQHELFLIVPIVYFLLVMSFLYNTQVGIRHLIFLIPLVCILCSSVVPELKANYQKIILGITSVYLVISVLNYWKNYFPYTNELILNKTFAYKYVGASNLEYHQDAGFANEFLQKHPSIRWITKFPESGEFLIRVDDYLDIWSRHTYDWIAGIEPNGQVGFSILLIRIKPSDLGR